MSNKFSVPKKYDILVFIGRFQPFHMGHKAVIEKAQTLADNVIVLVGGSNKPRTIRNPWSFHERQFMIYDSFLHSKNIFVHSLNDFTYNDDAWVKSVQNTVKSVGISEIISTRAEWNPDGYNDLKIGLIGCNKDSSSYYLKLFPQWGSENVEFINPLNATDIRHTLFGTYSNNSDNWPQVHEWANVVLPTPVARRILEADQYMSQNEFVDIGKLYKQIHEYKQQWGEGTFVTVDSIVTQSGHILLVERGGEFGKGLLALPGGFKNVGERILDGAIRELREETLLKVPEPVLRGSLKKTKAYDDPHRSDRGDLITHAHHFDLNDRDYLPEVRGADDAQKAFWMPYSDLEEEKFFEDHYHIIMDMLEMR